MKNQKKSEFVLHLLLYAEACNEWADPILVSSRVIDITSKEEMSQRWRAMDNTVPDLIGLRTSSSCGECVTAQPTGRLKLQETL